MKNRYGLALNSHSRGEVVIFDEPVYDESISEGRTVLIEQGSSFEVKDMGGRRVLLESRTINNERFVVFWPDDLKSARFLGRNEPLDENVAWDYYEYG